MEEAEKQKGNGFGRILNKENNSVVKVWLKIREDSQIPEFDVITGMTFEVRGDYENQGPSLTELSDLLTDCGGMFVNDVLALRNANLGAALNAVKKAIYNYLERTGQTERLRKATETVICRCKNVSDEDLRDLIKQGKGSLEAIQKYTSAGQGCGSCSRIIDDFIKNETRIKTGLGEIK